MNTNILGDFQIYISVPWSQNQWLHQKNADHSFKCPSICIDSATKSNWKFYSLTYINQTNHHKKVCIILMLAFGFNFLLDDTEFRSKVGLKFQLWEDTNQSALIEVKYPIHKINRRRRSITRRVLLGSIQDVVPQWSE